MTKVEFLERWAKLATAGKPVESFERDLESLMATTIRAATSGIAKGLNAAARQSVSIMHERILREVAATVVPAVEAALMRANGIEEEGEGHAQSNAEGPSDR